MASKFADTNDIKRLAPPAKGNLVVWDEDVVGLGVRVTSAGAKAFILNYRIDGLQRRYTIGSVSDWPLGRVRDEARRLKRAIDQGNDPLGEREERRAQVSAPKPQTFADVVEEFLTRGLEKKGRAAGYIADTRRNFANHVLPRWGSKALGEIARKDVIAALDEIAEKGTTRKVDGKSVRAQGGPIAANRVLAAVRALFNWAIKRGLLEANPCTLVDAPGEERSRERTLSVEEIRELWPAFQAQGFPFGPFFQMCLITGQRRTEVAQMRWVDIDLAEGIWSLGSDQTKNGRAHVVPLSKMAVEILTSLPRKTVVDEDRTERPSPWIFTSSGKVPISGFSRAKTDLERGVFAARKSEAPEAKDMADWGIHDLRRTVATELGRLGVSEFIIGKVLNHASKGITGMVYNRYEYVAEKRRALDAWATYLETLMSPARGNVVFLNANAS